MSIPTATVQSARAATVNDRRAARRRTRRVALVTVAGFVVATGACSSEPSTDAPSTSAAVGATTTAMRGAEADSTSTSSSAPVGEATSWQVSLTSEGTELHTVGPDGSLAYGWNNLTGSTTIDGIDAEVQLLGSVDYVDGTGPWTGFLSIITDDGTLGFRAVGHAERDEATNDTAFTGELEVIGGTGRYIDAAGSATLTGERLDALGGQVDFDVTMHLSGAQG